MAKTNKRPMKADLCFVISHGFAARMLLQTGLITQLAGKGLNVVIITPDANDDNLIALQEEERIAVHEMKDSKDLWSENYLFKRKYYLENIRENTALWEKHVHGLLYSTSKHPWRRIRPLYYWFIYRLIRYFPFIRDRFLEQEQQYLRSAEVEKLIRSIDPGLVISTYPVNLLEARILFAAKESGIPTLIQLLSWDNITCKGKFPVTADFYIVWGAIMKEELKEYYAPSEEAIFVCGVPHFDAHVAEKSNFLYKERLAELQLNPEAPYLLVAMSAPRFAPREIDMVEALVEQIESNYFGPDLQLVVRPHPQNVEGSMADQTWLQRLARLKSARVAVDYPLLVGSHLRWSMKKKDMNRLSGLLTGCSVCLNSGSTVSIDTLCVGKPVILTSFDGRERLPYWKSARRLVDYPHLKKLVQSGGVQVATSFDQLLDQIQHYLDHPDSDLSQRKKLLERQCYLQDGKATERVRDAIVELLERLYANGSG